MVEASGNKFEYKIKDTEVTKYIYNRCKIKMK
jgi:hypothetical protein